jgi:hypothetical protein
LGYWEADFFLKYFSNDKKSIRQFFKNVYVFVQICNGYSQLDLEERPTLFLEFHGSESGLKEQSNAVAEIADQNGGSNFRWATQQEERKRLWSAR